MSFFFTFKSSQLHYLRAPLPKPTLPSIIANLGQLHETTKSTKSIPSIFSFFFSFFFMDEPLAYRNSWASKSNWSHSHGLCHSHSNAVSELHLRPRPQIAAIPDPQATQWGQESNLYPHRDNVVFLICWATTGLYSFLQHLGGGSSRSEWLPKQCVIFSKERIR